MWAIIVTNQGVPVQVTLCSSQDELDLEVQKATIAWNVREAQHFNVLKDPPQAASHLFTAGVPMRRVLGYVDNLDRPKYFLSVVPKLKVAKTKSTSKSWQFCPDCGCSWLSHLSGPASLEPVDWDPCPCTECGCEKAVNL